MCAHARTRTRLAMWGKAAVSPAAPSLRGQASKGLPLATPHNIRTCAPSSHPWVPSLGWRPRGLPGGRLGPTVGAGNLSWESERRVTPSLGFLAQYGGQESPILPQGWPRREQRQGRLDGQTEGWTKPLVLSKLINRFVQGPLCGLGAKPRGRELVDWRGGSSLPSPGLGAPSPETSSVPRGVQRGAKVGRAGSRNVKISEFST